ncbi:hypothetical protein [Croceicoccus sp. BE223]|uniref:hypothetical protein n=1 Tax=Croceicoccus sp. BE223 TaxID=2817716 RepID=UPI00285F8274|nr:hypothetical protein [Croceicoccus sp. BE223]MDR7101435.1 hypothetical protein [Croceicoccus sp. BE223]
MTAAPLAEVAFDCPDLRTRRLVDGIERDDDRPAYAFEWAALWGQCRVALARRERTYPAMIAEKRIDQADADADVAAWRALAAEWEWICTGEGALPPPATLPARKRATELALNRVGEELRRGRRSAENEIQQLLIQAIAWHLARTRFGAPAVHFCAALNHGFEAQRKGTE